MMKHSRVAVVAVAVVVEIRNNLLYYTVHTIIPSMDLVKMECV